MLGEIVKNTEALRYHAKSAEVAGKNLAHVNDESYARQRVLSREGNMFTGQGGLQTSSIEAGGIDHMRDALLDKRLFQEFGESANLEAQSEILNLLQVALGESIQRQSIDGGLDDQHDSNLAAGGLSAALDDLFNSFHELSASPDEATTNQEIFNKIQTLTKRFNDAGKAIDEIESDLSESVLASVGDVNRLLSQIHEVNVQVRRFELIDRGKAVTYRDRRQALLEDLSKLIDFEIEKAVDQNGKETGFWNLSSSDKSGAKIDLVHAQKGVQVLTKDFGNIRSLGNIFGGEQAQVRARYNNNGELGHIEVIDGGSNYSDLNGPLIFTSVPPLVNNSEDGNFSKDVYQKGDVFSQNGKYYQVLAEKAQKNTDLSLENVFLEIDPEKIPSIGDLKQVPDSLKKFSHLENFQKGDQLYYQGKLYQATKDISIIEDPESTDQLIPFDVPELVPFRETTVTGSRWSLTQSFQQGDVFEYDGNYFEVQNDVFRGELLPDLKSFLDENGEFDQGHLFDGFASYIDNPNEKLIRDRGLFFESNNFKEYTLSGITGSEQVRQIAFNVSIPENGQLAEDLVFEIQMDGQTIDPIIFPSSDENGNPLPFTEERRVELFSFLEEELGKVPHPANNPAGTEEDSTTPAFSFTQDPTSGDFIVSGTAGVGDFGFTFNNPILTQINERSFEYSADEYQIEVAGRSLQVAYRGTPEETAQAIVDAVNSDEEIQNLVEASIENASVVIRALDSDFDFELIAESLNSHDVPVLLTPKPAFELVTSEDTLLSEQGDTQTIQVDTISSLVGSEQGKQMTVDLSLIDPTQSFSFLINFDGREERVSLDALPGRLLENEPQLPGGPELPKSFLEEVRDQLEAFQFGEPNQSGAFTLGFVPGGIALQGNVGLGDFNILPTPLGNLAENELTIVQDNVSADHNFLADQFDVEISQLTDDGDGSVTSIPLGNITVAYQSNPQNLASSIVSAINNKVEFADLVSAEVDESGENVLIKSKDGSVRFETQITSEDLHNQLSATMLSQSDDSPENVPVSSRIEVIAKDSSTPLDVLITTAQSFESKKLLAETNALQDMRFKKDEIYFSTDSSGEITHFVVTSPLDLDPQQLLAEAFNPQDAQWADYFKVFNPQLVDSADPTRLYRKSHPFGYNLYDGSLVELNLGVAEAIVKDGKIAGFNILEGGSSLPRSESVFVQGKELDVKSGSIKGMQEARSLTLEKFRNDLNDLVSTFVQEINSIYNPENLPGQYMFGFDAYLTRPVVGNNSLMEDEFDLYGREGDVDISLFRQEVDMSLPFPESESFTLVNAFPLFPEDFAGERELYRGSLAEAILTDPESAETPFQFYASSRRLNNLTVEEDLTYPGEDKIPGTVDDKRSVLMAYEAIPFRLEVEEGAKSPIFGDNFSFDAVLSNPWNLASSIQVGKNISADSIVSSLGNESGANEVAVAIAEMGNGRYVEEVALMNSDIGTNLADLSDNMEHQKSIETFLLDQRREVSSVSVDEEVANLMKFQRSFQASSRVLNTLDKMLEIVVMGLVR